MLKLQLHIGENGQTLGFSLNQKSISIGRRACNDIRVQLGSVSAIHAKFECDSENRLYVYDCDSLNGTFVNGEQVKGKKEVREKDTVSFGCLVCTIESFDFSNLLGGTTEEKLRSKLEDTRAGFSGQIHRASIQIEKLENSLSEKAAQLEQSDLLVASLKEKLEKSKVEYALTESKYLEHMTTLASYAEVDNNSSERLTQIVPNEEHLKVLSEAIEQLKSIAAKDLVEDDLTVNLLDRQPGTFSRKSLFHGEQNDGRPDQQFFVELIEWLVMFDDLIAFYDRKLLFPKLSEQLGILKESLENLLKKYSIDKFEIEPGERLTISSRNKIQLIHVDDLDDSKIKKAALKVSDDAGAKVVKTLRSGYIYRQEGKDVVIKKADVVIA